MNKKSAKRIVAGFGGVSFLLVLSNLFVIFSFTGAALYFSGCLFCVVMYNNPETLIAKSIEELDEKIEKMINREYFFISLIIVFLVAFSLPFR